MPGNAGKKIRRIGGEERQFVDQLSVGPPVIYRASKRMKNARGFLDRLKADRAMLLLLVNRGAA